MCINIVIAKINNKNDDDDDDKQTSVGFNMSVRICVLGKAVCKEVSFILLLLFSSTFSSNSIISVLKPTGCANESETENDTLLSFIKAKY
jgi:hypothetical protein